MSKMMLHDEAAREALGRGVARLTHAVAGTLGPKGMNAVIDRPIGTPIVSRDGVTIAAEVELECPFENMGAQIVREASQQTNDVAGDGTTTATILADALVQGGLAALAEGANAVDLVQGIDVAAEAAIEALRAQAKPVKDLADIVAVACIAANDETLGRMVGDAFAKAGAHGIVDVQFGVTVETTLDLVEGMSFDRGYVSHHMATDVESMQAILDNPLILVTDHKILAPSELSAVYAIVEKEKRALLVIAEEISPPCIMDMLARREKSGWPIVAVNPPEYGHWRKAMLEDIATITGGLVIARELGGRLDACEAVDLGSADQVTVSYARTIITRGGGKDEAIQARREQVTRQWEAAPDNIERDKFKERLAKLSGGTALILAGGATPVEQKRKVQLIEDAINAARAALEEGVVPGGGTAFVRAAPVLEKTIATLGQGAQRGADLLRDALKQPLARIAKNCGLDGMEQVTHVMAAAAGIGLDARTGAHTDLVAAGVIDPVKVVTSAVRNAASVAGLILTTQTLVAQRPDDYDPTAGPARGGGAERLPQSPSKPVN